MTTCDKCGHGATLGRCANWECDPWEYLANHETGEQFLRRKIGGKWLWVLDTGEGGGMKGWPTLAGILGDTETEYWDRIITHDSGTCPRCNGARAWATLMGDKWPASKLCLDGIAQLAFADEPLPPPKRRKSTPNRKNKA